jgi:uncharacterized membrane protein YccC
MRQEYEDYFADEVARRFPPRARGDQFDMGSGRPGRPDWRADAIYFLLLNLDELVARPTQAVPVRRDPTRLSPLSAAIQRDMGEIVRRAEAIARERSRNYVSATSAAIALGELSESLMTTAFQIWGPDPVDEANP